MILPQVLPVQQPILKYNLQTCHKTISVYYIGKTKGKKNLLYVLDVNYRRARTRIPLYVLKYSNQ